MKPVFLLAAFAFLLTACADPMFVTDAEPVPVTTELPDRFDLPASFALVRTIYGEQHAATEAEAALWSEVAERHAVLGHFSPLVTRHSRARVVPDGPLLEAARAQRYAYLLHLAIDPATGSSKIYVIHVGSGGVMATAQAFSDEGGRRGFWGGRINNPRRLARVTDRIARASLPVVETVLVGIAERR